MPRLLVYNFSIQQYPDKVVVFHATSNIATRSVRFDNRPPLPSSIRLWMGDSRGRWDGDTLVIETTNLNGEGWLNLGGDVMSDAMHITERYRMVNATTLSFEATIDDPKVFTRPWTMKFPGPHVRVGAAVVNDQEFDFEDSCLESNVDLIHFKNLYDAARAKSGSSIGPDPTRERSRHDASRDGILYRRGNTMSTMASVPGSTGTLTLYPCFAAYK